MTTDQHEAWQALDVRTPDDVPAATPLAWISEKHTVHSDRLMNNVLPDDWQYEVQRGTAEDAVAVLALRERLRKDMESGRGTRVHEAARLGATWAQIAAALDLDEDQARDLLRDWADRQHALYVGDVEAGRERPLGLDADQCDAVLALADRDDQDGADT